MFIGSKAYTLNRLIGEVSSIPTSANRNEVVDALSPRAGMLSVKIDVIDTFLNNHLTAVLNGTTTAVTGASARTRLLRALRTRKSTGFFLG